MSDRKRLIRTGIAAAILAAVYVVLIALAPRLSFWSYPTRFNFSENTEEKVINSGDIYEHTFNMPYDRITSIDPGLKNNSSNVISIDGTIELIDGNGNVVSSRHVTSAYDSIFSLREPVACGTTYTVRFTVVSVGSTGPSVLINADDSSMVFTIAGTGSGSSAKLIFAGIYVLISAMVLLYVYNLDKKGISDAKMADGVFIGVLILCCVFLICQYYDLFMIIKSALRMLDSFKSGNITDYYGFSYASELTSQSNKMLFAYEYNFFQIFFVAILMLPLSFAYNGDINGGGIDGLICVIYLEVILALLLIVCRRLIGRITKSTSLDDKYLKEVQNLFIFSPMLLYISVAYGQIDLMYMIVIILALPFYYRKKYYLFSLIMSLAVAMKTLPLMIFIPLILLANKRIRDIAVNFLIVMVLPVATALIFEGSSGHKAISAVIREDYSYLDRITEWRLGDTTSIFVLCFAVICIVCFMHKTDTEDKTKFLYDSQLAVFAVYGAFISFVTWHLQWMIPAVLALSLLIPLIKDKRILIMDTVLEILFIMTAAFMGTSTHMTNFGILPLITNEYSDAPEMTTIYNNISSITTVVIRTCLAAVIMYTLYMLVRNRKEDKIEYVPSSRAAITGRGLVMYAVTAFFCWTFFYVG